VGNLLNLSILVVGLASAGMHALAAPKTKAANAASRAVVEGEQIVEAVKCANGKDERKLEVHTRGPGCSLQYTKYGKTSEIALSRHSVDLCLDNLKKVRANLERAGHKCQ
jgi:hypothetical protein